MIYRSFQLSSLYKAKVVALKNRYDTLQYLEFIKWIYFRKKSLHIWHVKPILQCWLNEESVFSLIDAKYRHTKSFLLLTWLKYKNKKSDWHFLFIYNISCIFLILKVRNVHFWTNNFKMFAFINGFF